MTSGPSITVLDSGEKLIAVCVFCGAELGDDVPGFFDSVNLTPDTLLVDVADRQFQQALVELDIAFDWCSVDCFGRSLFSAAAQLGWRPRP